MALINACLVCATHSTSRHRINLLSPYLAYITNFDGQTSMKVGFVLVRQTNQRV